MVSLALIVSCSRTPTQPNPFVTIAITAAPDVLLVGESFALEATNTVTQEVVDAAWSSSNPAVASTAGAQIQAVSAGRVTVTARYQGASATASVKIVPNFAGTYPAPPEFWGTVYRVGCVDLTSFAVCASNFPPTQIIRLEVTQTKDRVSGRVFLIGESGAVTGEIGDVGQLTVRGTLFTGPPDPFPIRTLDSWSSYLDANGAMWGTFTSRFFARDGTALVRLTQELRGLSHGV